MLNGQVAIVTGASRGIGAAIALALAKAGARVVGTATSPAGAEAIAKAFADAGAQGTGRVLDVRDGAACAAFVESVAAESGPVGILVNNAGVTRDNLILRLKTADWDEVLNTNLRGAFSVTRAVVPGMVRQRSGRIISITSVVGQMGNAGQSNYAASKAGLIGMTQSLARELASRSITVNAVAPGYIETDMTGTLAPAQQEALRSIIPLARLGKSEDVAEAVAFLASDAASYITGQVLNVNGGMYM
jgi:3-oxoacyl-[acyl-carrier protein] reductase